MSEKIDLAVLGGSGMYSMPGLTNTKEYNLETPFGKPSAPVVVGSLNDKRVAFLARHGIGHHIMPGEVNYRANIYALKMLGTQRLVSISACGSLKEELAPGHIVIPDQIFDYTKDRNRTFFGDGLVVHIGVAEPFCKDLSLLLYESVRKTGTTTHKSGTLITIEGPRFSTRAESNIFRSWGISIIGMTTSPEAYLAREAEICFSVMAHVTDYDVWHTSEAPVTVEMIIEILNKNTHAAQNAIRNLLEALPGERTCECKTALSNALITDRKKIPAETLRRLDLLVGKYLK